MGVPSIPNKGEKSSFRPLIALVAREGDEGFAMHVKTLRGFPSVPSVNSGGDGV